MPQRQKTLRYSHRTNVATITTKSINVTTFSESNPKISQLFRNYEKWLIAAELQVNRGGVAG